MLTLDWSELDGSACIRIRGARPLAVTVAGAPVAGRFVAFSGGVLFVPRFPPLAGTVYMVAGASESAEIALPPPDAEANVIAVYPSGAVIPRNALRIYVWFSHEMREGEASRCIRLVDDCGARSAEQAMTMDQAFLPGPELWDATRRRLTLLLDPGRIKRGLVPQAELGYPLVEGSTVRLVVDESFRDAEGATLVASHERRYEIGPDVRTRVDPHAWRVEPPCGGTRDPLVVRFDRALDHGLLQHALRLGIDGIVDTGPAELSWRFMPDAPWITGVHHLRVDESLEDLAGNSVRRVFDRELADPGGSPGRDGNAVRFVVQSSDSV